MEHALVLDGVTKTFGDFVAVDNISLRIPKGCIYGFLGPNGAGKTTTLRMIMSIFLPDSGSISILGRSNAREVKDRLGYLPEEKGLYKKMKVGETITYFAMLKGLDLKTAKRRTVELLEQVDLSEWIDKPCEALSKGMGQKVQVLITLVHNPELVILDEVFSGFDPVNVEMIRNVILQLKRDGKTVIFSTHVMEQAEQICDSILLINKGSKILDGPLSEVKSRGDKGVIIDYDGDGHFLKQLPGIKRINDAGKHAELFLEDGIDPQDLLAQLVGKLTIRRFDLREPSLHEIFVRTVGGDNGV